MMFVELDAGWSGAEWSWEYEVISRGKGDFQIREFIPDGQSGRRVGLATKILTSPSLVGDGDKGTSESGEQIHLGYNFGVIMRPSCCFD